MKARFHFSSEISEIPYFVYEYNLILNAFLLRIKKKSLVISLENVKVFTQSVFDVLMYI